jgi:predicted RNase H-related nuclease YkuK (DUF458 family)
VVIEKKWKTLAGEEVGLRSTIEAVLREFPDAELTIASDSQQRGQYTEYVTVVTLIRPGKGGRVIFNRELIPRVRELRERLWKETWRSTELAMELTETPDIGDRMKIDVAAIHIDANIEAQVLEVCGGAGRTRGRTGFQRGREARGVGGVPRGGPRGEAQGGEEEAARGEPRSASGGLTAMERWPSGLRHMLGKHATPKGVRGFESHPPRC